MNSSNISRRMALDFWRVKLNRSARETLAGKHFPNLPFVAVDMSSSKIEQIYKSECK